MLLENSISKLIRLYEETTFIPQSVIFSTGKTRVQSLELTGELLFYYQHLEIKEDLFFANQNFNIILLLLDSYARTVECWALQDVDQFTNGQFQIFASTDIDDILFCYVREETQRNSVTRSLSSVLTLRS